MRFPLSWLGEWLQLPGDLKDTKNLLFQAGIEVEAIESKGQGLDNVVVARVLTRDPHPNADKLSLCRVTDGTAEYQIVCGAQNFKAGDVVPLAREGAVLPGDFKIKKSKIRGVESFGMLCAADELGLAEASDGLMILDPSLPLGAPLARALKLDEVVVTVATTANRPDHNSICGIARELAAMSGQTLRWPAASLREAGAAAESFAKVATEDPQACPYYSARVIRGVKVGPSPEWVAARLEACGARPINNVVDVTNIVLFELGQPLHAFDLAKLKGAQVAARRARPAEGLLTLDGAELKLKPEDLVIADAAGPVALAGIMGGELSSVGEGTADVLLESAWFDPATVRRGARRHAMGSESSYRFERGVDPRMVAQALDRAAALIAELSGGVVQTGRLEAGAPPLRDQALPLEVARINALLGTKFSLEQAVELLQRRGFAVREAGNGMALVTAPSWRRDIAGESDLAEEVMQMAGFDTLASTGLSAPVALGQDAAQWKQAQVLREACVKLGLDEAITLSYLDPELAKPWGMLAAAVRMDNPISEEQSLLRPSLLPNLVGSVAHNLKHKAPGCSLFEFGTTFAPRQGQPPAETTRLAIVIAGDDAARGWNHKPRALDFYDLKAAAAGLAECLGTGLRVQPCAAPQPWMHPGQAADVRLGCTKGFMAALHPGLCEALGVKASVYALELEIPDAADLGKDRFYKGFSRLPGVTRDISCLAPAALDSGRIMDFFAKDPALAGATVTVRDLFVDPKLGEGQKSLTYSILYQAEGRTLTDAEVNASHEAMCARLENALGVSVRRN